MADVNESTSESDNIIVSSITDFSESLHPISKKANNFKIGKDPNNRYSARLGLNMFKLPDGEFSFVIEFLPPKMDELSVNVVSESLNASCFLGKSKIDINFIITSKLAGLRKAS